MNKIEKEILENQNAIMNFLFASIENRKKHSTRYLMERINATVRILIPKENERDKKVEEILERKTTHKEGNNSHQQVNPNISDGQLKAEDRNGIVSDKSSEVGNPAPAGAYLEGGQN